jgi:hypothetical protein
MSGSTLGAELRRTLATFRRKNELFRRASRPAKTKNTAGGGRREVVSRVELSETVKARTGSPFAMTLTG